MLIIKQIQKIKTYQLSKIQNKLKKYYANIFLYFNIDLVLIFSIKYESKKISGCTRTQ